MFNTNLEARRSSPEAPISYHRGRDKNVQFEGVVYIHPELECEAEITPISPEMSQLLKSLINSIRDKYRLALQILNIEPISDIEILINSSSESQFEAEFMRILSQTGVDLASRASLHALAWTIIDCEGNIDNVIARISDLKSGRKDKIPRLSN